MKRIKKKIDKHAHSPFILDIPIFVCLFPWQHVGTGTQPGFTLAPHAITILGERVWLNARMMRLHCMQLNPSISLEGVFWKENIPKSTLCYVLGEVLRAVVMKSSVFWDISPCSLLTVTVDCYLIHAGYLYGLPFNADFGRTKFPLKRQLTFNGLHCVTSQNIDLFTL
jgi:hypothetical protein